MKLKDGMVLDCVDGDYVAVATGAAGKAFCGLIRNNETADFLYRQLMSERTEDELVAALLEKYDVRRDQAEKDVRALLAKLQDAGLLDA